jgi:hypothetical protein
VHAGMTSAYCTQTSHSLVNPVASYPSALAQPCHPILTWTMARLLRCCCVKASSPAYVDGRTVVACSCALVYAATRLSSANSCCCCGSECDRLAATASKGMGLRRPQ